MHKDTKERFVTLGLMVLWAHSRGFSFSLFPGMQVASGRFHGEWLSDLVYMFNVSCTDNDGSVHDTII